MVVNSAQPYNWKIILISLMIISIVALLILLRRRLALIYKRVLEYLGRIGSKSKKYPPNSIKGLINKKVYLENGNYLGKITDAIIENNKIESLKIKLDEKDKSKAKGIIVQWNKIVSCGEIVIIGNLNLDKATI